jgi:hypothetical protein
MKKKIGWFYSSLKTGNLTPAKTFARNPVPTSQSATRMTYPPVISLRYL